jgi:hypothetical protein
MALSDFSFYAGMSPEKFVKSIGLPTDGYQLLWYRAEDITPVEDGYTFEYWPEALRGNVSGYRLAQSDPSARMAYFSNQLNGYPIVRGNGSSWMVGESGLFTANVLDMNCYLFAVFRSVSASGQSTGIGIGGGASTNISIGSSGTNITLRFGGTTLSSGGTWPTPWQIRYGHRLTTGTARNLVGINNLDLAVSAGQPTSSSVSWVPRLNTTNGTAVISGATTDQLWAEALILTGNSSFSLTDEQISEINYYLSSKYNISLESPETVNRFYYSDAKNSFRPQLHETLSNPLPLNPDGYFCRSAELPTGGADGYTTLTRHSVADGYLIGLDNTSAVSLRAWVRASGLVSGGKSQMVLFTHMDDPWKGYNEDNFIAYGLKFGTISDGYYSGLGLRIGLRDSDGYFHPSYPDISCSGTYDEDTWYRIRMDVLPIGSAEDRISVYTGSGNTGEEIWTPVGSATIQSGQPVYREKSAKNQQGYFVSHVDKDSSYLTTKYFIDRFQILAKDL